MDALPATEITALLGRGTRFEGKLYFEGRVRVDGIFKGEIKSDDTLIIGDGAEVHAEIDVATVIIRGGVVHGNVRASQSIEIHAPGKLVGNIHSPSLFIERGVEFQGSCSMDAVDASAPSAPSPPDARDAHAATRGAHDARETADNRNSRDMAAQPRA
jgi:cytoskeletal protein CcmA (bactofilin family)